ncbi:unnamed protein product [Dovyalis caffra]|uniref:non-specific serine/threonine protein kinase n=1 Tax=Dovyalis caffra TaxID=77055 RepID=A0AAV1RTZ6_9ROSI|nr:unnamed protein product [Dovyalis caffra]
MPKPKYIKTEKTNYKTKIQLSIPPSTSSPRLSLSLSLFKNGAPTNLPETTTSTTTRTTISTTTRPTTSKDLDFDSIRAIKVLGKGAMGTVFLVHNQETDPTAKNPFALKVVEKSTLHTKFDADRRARWEIQVLNQLSTPKATHPFLPHLIASIETQEFLAWAVPFVRVVILTSSATAKTIVFSHLL